jgi:acyl-CoA reductase-like NAD-dependent aldehyde dehydrogenase
MLLLLLSVQFVSKLVEKIQSIRLGDPMSTDTQMGPLISAAQRDKVERFVQLAKEEGASILTGGRRPQNLPVGFQSGFYYEPTLIGNVHPQMRVVREEVFGPVVVVYKFKDEADAIRLANDSPFGLAAAVWTKDVKRAHRVADAVRVGLVWINDHHRNSPSSPWGGFGDSGMGRENGLDAYHEYTASKVLLSFSPNSIHSPWIVIVVYHPLLRVSSFVSECGCQHQRCSI